MMSDWHYGVVTALLVFPLWATWMSWNKIMLFQRGIIEPFILAFLAGIAISIASAISKNWSVWDTVIAFCTGIALIVIITKGVRGTLMPTEEEEED
jgi:membrane associated rhomboid family serine protease